MSGPALAGARVLVTGGAGFIGSWLVERRVTASPAARVIVLDDLSTGRLSNLDAVRSDVDVRVGSVLDPAAVEQAVAGADVVFHLACLGVRHSIRWPLANHQVNAEGTLRVLSAARESGVRRFVHVSSSEVFGSARQVPMTERHPTFPETVYGGSKLAGEAYARAFHRTYGLPTVVVRPFNNYGPRSHYEGDSGELIPRTAVRLLAGEPPLVFGDGRQTRDFLHVSDTARALLELAACDDAVGLTVNVGSGRETSILEVCRELARVVGRPDLAPVHLPPRPGDVRRLWADGALAESLVGFRPSVALTDGLAGLVAHLRASADPPDRMLAAVAARNW